MEATERLKREMCGKSCPRPADSSSCHDSGCDDPICMAAEQVQQDLPFMDFAGARELVIEQQVFMSYKEQVQVCRQGQREQHTTMPC